MKIAIDLDGVVVNLVGQMLPKLSELAGRRVSPVDIVEFDIGAALELNRRQMEELWAWLRQTDSYRRARPVEGALGAILRLKQLAGRSILFVTCRPEELRPETTDWLQSHGLAEFPLMFRPEGPKVLASDQAAMLIEDDPRDIHALSRLVERLILLERPWNRSARLPANCLRVPRWRDVVDAVSTYSVDVPK